MSENVSSNETLSFEVQGNNYSFNTVNELVQWLGFVLKWYRYAKDMQSVNIHPIRTNFENLETIYYSLNGRDARGTQVKTYNEEEKFTNAKNELIRITSCLSQGNVILPESPEYKFLDKLQSLENTFSHELARKQFNYFLGFCYLLLINHDQKVILPTHLDNESSAAYMQALVIVKDYYAGNADTNEAILGALSDSQAKWESRHQELFTDNKLAFDELFKQLNEQLDNAKTLYKAEHKNLGDLNKEFRTHIDNSSTEWEALKNTYHDQMALKAPATYWQKQKQNFMWQTIGWTVITAFLIGAAFHTLTKVAGYEGATTISRISVFHLTLIILTTAISVWLVQLFAKITLSRLRLHTEAGLRLLTIETYLALESSKDVKVDQETFKNLLIQIFRPLPTGLSKEKGLSESLDSLIRPIKR